MPKLLTLNAFGLVSVEGSTINVILTAIEADGHQINRTVKGESEKPFGLSGSALIAVDITAKEQTLHVHELGKDEIATHPKVKKTIKQAIDWIVKSAE